MGDHIQIGKLIPSEHIKWILKLPKQDFYTEEHESGEEFRIKKKK